MPPWLKQLLADYRNDIHPLRDAADNGLGDYSGYDESYNVWLEELHAALTDWEIESDNAKCEKIDPAT